MNGIIPTRPLFPCTEITVFSIYLIIHVFLKFLVIASFSIRLYKFNALVYLKLYKYLYVTRNEKRIKPPKPKEQNILANSSKLHLKREKIIKLVGWSFHSLNLLLICPALLKDLFLFSYSFLKVSYFFSGGLINVEIRELLLSTISIYSSC